MGGGEHPDDGVRRIDWSAWNAYDGTEDLTDEDAYDGPELYFVDPDMTEWVKL